MFRKYVKNEQGMITIESLIVFPLTFMIMLVFSAYLLLEFEKSYVEISSNKICLDSLLYDVEKSKDYNYSEVSLNESPFKVNLEINREIILTSEIMPEWVGGNITYCNKSVEYNKFNLLTLKDALFDGFVDEIGGGD